MSAAESKVHTRDAEFKGYTHHATPADPEYEVKNDKFDHIAILGTLK